MRTVASVLSCSTSFEIPNECSSTPEKVLLAAILWRAFWDLKSKVKGCQDKKSAIRWFESKNDLYNYFSYRNIVEILNLSAAYQQIIAKAVFNAKHGILDDDYQSKAKRKKSRTQYSPMVERPRYRFRT